MTLQFRTADNKLWQIDTVDSTWKRMETGEDGLTDVEWGDLVAHGNGNFTFVEKKPPELCTVSVLAVPLDTTVIIWVYCNLPVKELTTTHPFTEVRLEIVPNGKIYEQPAPEPAGKQMEFSEQVPDIEIK